LSFSSASFSAAVAGVAVVFCDFLLVRVMLLLFENERKERKIEAVVAVILDAVDRG
jgi:hypothetical protein